MKEQGQFSFSSEGLQMVQNSEPIEVYWADVREITAYKVDLLTVDEIRIDIVTHEAIITITEETPGYYTFKVKLKTIFPDSDMEWEEKVVKSAFAENLTIIYKK
ncbi:hypothetical protein [Adhaeribacter pallidiroseus]|uniref:Uncharacterized protein n=1 Tax=Adhaeribacter pallidiroseus TaxID=2072847 RepID=A0A369QI65_9BACT|nr:hypothetical protein [Adhaeribacter pallidiroseus]RDC64414.1 hypothetical protein AHMF7616_03028 [Adhaeribacter pallidiroseus]